MPQLFLLLGKLPFYFYGLLIGVGLVFWYFYIKKYSSEFNISSSKINLLFIILLFSSLIGARIYHVLSWFSYYKIFPKEIFFVWNGGLGIFGALVGGLLGLAVFKLITKSSILDVLNLISPPLLVTQAIGRLGNFFNQEGFGPPTNLPWKFYVPVPKRPINFVDQSYFHPTFLYESILCFLAFTLFLFLKKKGKVKKTSFVGFYFVSYGLIRFFSEFLRLDTWKIFDIQVAHLASLLMVLFGLLYCIHDYLRHWPGDSDYRVWGLKKVSFFDK